MCSCDGLKALQVSLKRCGVDCGGRKITSEGKGDRGDGGGTYWTPPGCRAVLLTELETMIFSEEEW